MTARVLLVDDVLANLKLLEARLAAEYFDCILAMSGPEALALAMQGRCDVILLDVMMPGMDGFEVCRRLKADPATAHVPVIMITALDQPSDRVRGLEAGADDFLTKPVDDLALISRVKSLARLKVAHDELRGRALTAAGLGLPTSLEAVMSDSGEGGAVLIVDDRASSYERLSAALAKTQRVDIETKPQEAVFRAAEGAYDLVLISLNFRDFDALRLVAQLRSLERTRHVPVVLIAEPEDRVRLLRGLDIGVNDYLTRPVDRNELVARCRAQIKRRRYIQTLRDNVLASIEASVLDQLTGLYNRRYLESHLAAMLGHAVARNAALSITVLDIDHFKSINDGYGHDAGDAVLRGFALRVKSAIRGADLLCRLGGEEFVVVMPDTSLEIAKRVADRVCAAVSGQPFAVRDELVLSVTVSIGVAERDRAKDAETILARADRALYRSKREGRNRVTMDAA